MGWPEEQTLNSSMPYIETAYRGRVKMLQAIFGGGTKEAETIEPTRPAVDMTRPLTPTLFDATFGSGGII